MDRPNFFFLIPSRRGRAAKRAALDDQGKLTVFKMPHLNDHPPPATTPRQNRPGLRRRCLKEYRRAFLALTFAFKISPDELADLPGLLMLLPAGDCCLGGV